MPNKKLEIYQRICGKCENLFKTQAKSRGKGVRCKKCGGWSALT